jgi:hypothetical protein
LWVKREVAPAVDCFHFCVGDVRIADSRLS